MCHDAPPTSRGVDDAIATTMYNVEFDDEQRARLDAVFPNGVCDYTVPGVGQGPPIDTWQRFG